MRRNRGLLLTVPWLVLACGDGKSAGTPDAGPSGPTKTLSDYLPPLPAPDGTARAVFAGPITQANAGELIAGPAKSGLVGDFFMRNAVAHFVIQSPARVIGIVPWGGNIVDAALIGPDGADVAPDHLGEVSMVYLLGRTCAHDKVEVLLDGAGGGPAVIRATGKSAVNDYVNLKGMGYFVIPMDVDPDTGDEIECATTYTLEPGSPTVHIDWTLYNPGAMEIHGPFGMLNDTGGEIQVFGPHLGFSHLSAGLDVLLQNDVPQSVFYDVYQGPGVAYGVVPRQDDPAAMATGIVIAGASVVIYGASSFFDILDRTKDALHLPANGGGVNFKADLVVGRDGADVEAAFQTGRGAAVTPVTGTVAYQPSGAPGAGARVGIYLDVDGDHQLGDSDLIFTYLDTDADGHFAGSLPPGTYLVRADVPDTSRSVVEEITVGAAALPVPQLVMPDAARFDYTVVDDDDPDAKPMPVKITVIGHHPFPLDARFTQTHDRLPGVVRKIYAVHGTSVPPGDDPADAAIFLPEGGPYKLYFSHGPEWSLGVVTVDSTKAGDHAVLPPIHLKRVVDTTGYVSTAFHEHSMGSPDSPVGFEDRVKTLVTDGTEFFTSTDHDFVYDYAPLIDALGVRGWAESAIGIEATPFAYGHFNGYPMDHDANDPSGGAVDWGNGPDGYAMLPLEVWQGLRARGAKVVQVCHPRSSGFASFQGYFGRAGLTFDFAGRTITGDALAQEVPSSYLRLPENQSLFSDQFDALEIWNQLTTGDTDGDGVLEFTITDLVLRDWMNFLSFGKVYAPLGNADTHTLERDTAGIPRSLVRVPDDSFDAIKAGIDDDVYKTVLGQTVRDIVVSDGPMIKVSSSGGSDSLIGRTITATPGQPVTLDITAMAADWVDFDTIEIFANNTFDPITKSTQSSSLPPVACFTSRPLASLAATDPCKLAPHGGAQAMTVSLVPVGGYQRLEAHVTLSLAAADIPVRAGATGQDAWLVVRVRGRRALFPMMMDGAVDDTNLDTILTGSAQAASDSLLNRGIAAMAFTAPIFVDFDGGGYRAPFQP